MEKYSVLMSIYKKENPDNFRLALESMINQTVKPDEIVLVEDGPLTDELYAVIDKNKNNLRIIKNEVNRGLGISLNIGLEACKNELVARMDTDDIAITDRCEKQLIYFEKNPSTSVLGGQIEEFINSTNDIVGKRVVPETDKEIKAYMKKRCPFNHMTVMFKKSDVISAGNYKDWHYNEDYYLWIRLALKEFEFSNLPDTLVYTRVGNDMYNRRGGNRYFKSEIAIQKLMLNKKMIGFWTFQSNCLKRFIVQILLPNKLRGWVFQKFARK